MGCGCGGTAKKIIGGAAGVAKATLGIDKAAPAVVAVRLEVCRGCDRATRNPQRLDRPTKGLTTLSRCTECKCLINLKVKVAGETCPLGKWAAVTAS